MRCVCCDVILNKIEDGLKNARTGEREQVCFACLEGLNVEVIGTKYIDDWGVEHDPDAACGGEDYLYQDDELDEEWRDS